MPFLKFIMSRMFIKVMCTLLDRLITTIINNEYFNKNVTSLVIINTKLKIFKSCYYRK